MMTKKQIDEMAALEAKATPGMWFGQWCYDGARTICQMRSTDKLFCINQQVDGGEPKGYDATLANAEFITAARTFIPAAIQAIRELEPRAAFGDQCLQDRYEGALIEQTVVDLIRKELEAEKAENKLLRQEVLKARIRELLGG